MGLFETSGQNPLGLNPGKQEKVRVTMRDTAGVKGQVVVFDIPASATGVVDSTTFGVSTDPTANVRAVAAGEDGDVANSGLWLYAVLDEDIASGAQGYCVIRGYVQVLGGDGSIGGIGLSVEEGTSGELVASPVNTRTIALSVETMVNATLGWVLFDGINGFGVRGV